MILIVIKFPVRPDRIDEFRAHADEYAAAVNAEATSSRGSTRNSTSPASCAWAGVANPPAAISPAMAAARIRPFNENIFVLRSFHEGEATGSQTWRPSRLTCINP